MKQTMIWITILLLFPVASHANIVDGCTAYYPFNGDWIDGSPMGITAVTSGNPSFDEGKKGQAVFLDGVDDCVILGKNSFIDQLSISLWLYLPKLEDTWQSLVSIYDETTINDITHLEHTFYLKVLGQTNDHRLYFAVTENGQQSSDIVSTTSIMPEIWYHIVAIFHEGNLLLYINGQKENEKQAPFQQLYTSSIQTLVGAMFSNGIPTAPFAHMLLDELRLYNRYLSVSEILMLYEQQSGSKVISHQPTGIQNERVSFIEIQFDQPILSSLFGSEDILMKGPSGQTISVNEPEHLSNNTLYRCSFPEQSANGLYTVNIGPNIIDHAGNPLNQDQDDINGESEDDVYIAEFKLNVMSDNVLVINFSGSFDDGDALNLYSTLMNAGGKAEYINLSSEKSETTLVSKLTHTDYSYQQVWIFDVSDRDGYYPQALIAISEWFLKRNGSQIICDGRMRASYWAGQWEKKGQLLTENYYENLKLNGGGLLLATDHPDDQPDINSICDQINIAQFGDFAGYKTVQTDISCQLMGYPNELGETLGTTSKSSMVPTGKQSNDMFLYCVAWDTDHSKNCSISTTILPLIPTSLSAHVNGNSIELTWKQASPESNVAYYNVYARQTNYNSIKGLAPVQSGITETHATIRSLQDGKTYYLAVTAVDIQNRNERYEVSTISAKTDGLSRSSGGDGGGGCFLDLIWK
jgi:hypothetical protein